MNIQIYGAKKCFDTKKAERYFKERKIPFQSIDIHRFGMSKSVFESAKRCIDEKKREGTLFENPALFRTPIVRNGKEFTLGYCPDVWKNWE